jgi:pimeloyl-ACP methyl ester carboxylesterase
VQSQAKAQRNLYSRAGGASAVDASAASPRVIGNASSVVMPSGGDTRVQPPPPKPCVTIVVHGVNDLAGVYASIEQGLCDGLNERLDLAFQPDGSPGVGRLEAASYTSPANDYGVAFNPDAVYYRRRFSDATDGRATRSVVIPFYWGFREEEAFIDKTTPHGEWLDRNGNRLDKAGTKEGGQFANATTTLPDMWGDGFSGKLFGFIPMHWFSPDPSHPLFRSAARKYMVLAAMRLAMLIRIIRKRYPDDVINVVGHSQGNLLNLLAQAMLADEGDTRPADCCIMMNPPYSLHEPWTEGVQLGHRQQTTHARVETLKQIVAFIDAQATAKPALRAVTLAGCVGYGAIGGPRWTGGKGSKAMIDGQELSFDDTDNRGCTYLYFTPQDQTVGLANVQGIGWQGVPEMVNGKPARSVLSSRFYQRVFTLRRRDGEREKVGSREAIDRYVLRRPGEKTWEDTGLGWFDSMRLSRASFDENQSVQLRGHRLPVPLEVDYAHEGTVTVGNAPSDKDATGSGVYQVKTPYDPIDAAIVVSNGGWEPKNREYSQEELLDEQQVYRYGSGLAQITESRNLGREQADKAEVFSAQKLGNGQVLIVRGETPFEARIRLQNQDLGKQIPLSFHSGIPANPEHSRRVLAFDVAVGAGRSVDDLEFYAYLCRVADWRLDWKRTHAGNRSDYEAQSEAADPIDEVMLFYERENARNLSLINATCLYRSSAPVEKTAGEKPATQGGGILPSSVLETTLPSLVISRTKGDRH